MLVEGVVAGGTVSVSRMWGRGIWAQPNLGLCNTNVGLEAESVCA